MIAFWVDDVRQPNLPEGCTHWYLNSRNCIAALRSYKMIGAEIDVMSLDHDLGGDDTSREIVLWMCVNEYWPKVVRVHSANPVGREWLEGMIDRYKP